MNFHGDTVIIDVQFVIGNGKEYYIKEMALLHLNPLKIENFIFKSPFDFSMLLPQARKQNFFIYKNINGLCWEDGDIELSKLEHILKNISENCSRVIVKGIEKKRMLANFLPNNCIEDLQMETNLDSCFSYGICCDLHIKRLKCRCAINNVLKIRHYLNENQLL